MIDEIKKEVEKFKKVGVTPEERMDLMESIAAVEGEIIEIYESVSEIEDVEPKEEDEKEDEKEEKEEEKGE